MYKVCKYNMGPLIFLLLGLIVAMRSVIIIIQNNNSVTLLAQAQIISAQPLILLLSSSCARAHLSILAIAISLTMETGFPRIPLAATGVQMSPMQLTLLWKRLTSIVFQVVVAVAAARLTSLHPRIPLSSMRRVKMSSSGTLSSPSSFLAVALLYQGKAFLVSHKITQLRIMIVLPLSFFPPRLRVSLSSTYQVPSGLLSFRTSGLRRSFIFSTGSSAPPQLACSWRCMGSTTVKLAWSLNGLNITCFWPSTRYRRTLAVF